MMMKEYSLSAELRTGYLDIKVQGLRSFESAAAMAEEVFRADPETSGIPAAFGHPGFLWQTGCSRLLPVVQWKGIKI